MAAYTSWVKKDMRIHVPTIISDIFGRKDPEEFLFNGSQIYHGMQGQGKTISMVFHAIRIKRSYPKLLVVANIRLSYLKPYEVNNVSDLNTLMESDEFKSQEWQKEHYIYYQSYDMLLFLLRRARNGKFGVHFMIDEIHQYFHSHDSKSMPVWVVQIFSQQRKQYILITGTVQVWENVIKALREQIQNLIGCNRIGWMIRQTVVDPLEFESQFGERIAPVKKRGFFWMSKTLRNSYDTRQLIESGREIFGGNETHVKVMTSEQTPQKRGIFQKRGAR